MLAVAAGLSPKGRIWWLDTSDKPHVWPDDLEERIEGNGVAAGPYVVYPITGEDFDLAEVQPMVLSKRRGLTPAILDSLAQEADAQ